MAIPEVIKDIDARIIRPKSTDNAIVKFDGEYGQVQNTENIIDDSNNTEITGYLHINYWDKDSEYSLRVGKNDLSHLDVNYNGIQAKRADNSSNNLYLNISGGEIFVNDNFLPYQDNTHTLGNKDLRFKNIYASNFIGIADSANKLNTDAGANNIPIYFLDGIPVESSYNLDDLIRPSNNIDIPSITNIIIADKLSTDCGTLYRPIFIKNGLPTDCGETLDVSITGNSLTATYLKDPTTFKVQLSTNKESSGFNGLQGTIHDIGVSGVLGFANGGTGSLDAPIVGGIIYGGTTSYQSLGVGIINQILASNGQNGPKWLDTTIGGQKQPVYLKDGVITACTTTVGGQKQPVYLNGGVITACDSIDSETLTVSQATSSTQYYITGVSGVGTKKTFYAATPYSSASGNTTGIYFQGSTGVLYGAAWNDYAEYRESNITQPGRCIIENGDDTLSLSIKRLQRGAEIVSDTFGFAIGETDICKTPVAASGRVLAYGYEDREQFKSHIGYPVCSGPNGTVSIMTDEEEQLYPSRIIGYISAVPDYEIWGTGNVKVNGRIWIRIK